MSRTLRMRQIGIYDRHQRLSTKISLNPILTEYREQTDVRFECALTGRTQPQTELWSPKGLVILGGISVKALL